MGDEIQIKIGTIYGELKVLDNISKIYNFIERRTRRKNTTRYYRKCRCSCGNIVFVRSTSLVTGKTRSCGHLQVHMKPQNKPIELLYSSLFRNLLTSSKNRNIKVELTQDEAIVFFKSNCFYCNSAPSMIYSVSKYRSILHTGIDRLNSDEGYTVLNTVPCCAECNFSKHTKSLDSFLLQVKSIYENIKLENYIGA